MKIGEYVKVDVTGTGQWLVGRVSSVDGLYLTLEPSDGGDPVKVRGQHCCRSSRTEFINADTSADSSSGNEWQGVMQTHSRRSASTNGIEIISDEDVSRMIAEVEDEPEEELHTKESKHVDDKGNCLHIRKLRLNPKNSTGMTHKCARCGATMTISTKNLMDKYVHTYTKHPSKTLKGRNRVDNCDEVASKLRLLSLDETYEHAAIVLGVTVSELRDRYEKLNPGMQRMNLGNRIRAAIRRDSENAELLKWRDDRDNKPKD